MKRIDRTKAFGAESQAMGAGGKLALGAVEVRKPTLSPTRYSIVGEEKAGGATYTPKVLADFVAAEIVHAAALGGIVSPRILDPAVGDGELLLSLLARLSDHGKHNVEAYGFETDEGALRQASTRLRGGFPGAVLHLRRENFLEFTLRNFDGKENETGSLFARAGGQAFDLVIANPPYVRTQIMGARQAQLLARCFGLTGRVDLYYAFLLAMARVLKAGGIGGIIVSNRFMTTRSGATVRQALRERFKIRHVWDLGDSKLFTAAVLPAVLLVEGKNGTPRNGPAVFTAIYETDAAAELRAHDPIDALSKVGVVEVDDGRRFVVQRGKLENHQSPDAVWRIATAVGNAWLATVERHTSVRFGYIGKIRVGVKTCADDVFIRSDWDEVTNGERPELLRKITTHHIARRFKALTTQEDREILYPHEIRGGRRSAVRLEHYPQAAAYLERHRAALERRAYVIEAGRQWYEIWVPQDPSAWDAKKLVFRDIAEEPTFWVDEERSVVNGDCYWLTCERAGCEDLLWLAAAVGNSTFIEAYYDESFRNKLYAGRRRFMTQYVERFPLPDPSSAVGKAIIAKAKQAHALIETPKAAQLQREINELVWRAFGLPVKEVSR